MGIKVVIAEGSALLIKAIESMGAVEGSELVNFQTRFTWHGLMINFGPEHTDEAIDAFIAPFKDAGWGFSKHSWGVDETKVSLAHPSEGTRVHRPYRFQSFPAQRPAGE